MSSLTNATRTKNILKGQKRKRSQSLAFMLILFILLSGIVISVAYMMLDDDQTNSIETLERTMTAQSQQNANTVSGWFRELGQNITTFTSLNNIRILATEISNQQNLAAPRLGHSTQLPLAKKQLSRLLKQDSIITASIYDLEKKQVIQGDDALNLTDEDIQALQTSLETGQTIILPIQVHEFYGTIFTLITPIFKQDYTDKQVQEIGALLVMLVQANQVIDDIVGVLPMNAGYGYTLLLEYYAAKSAIYPMQSAEALWLFPEFEKTLADTTQEHPKTLSFSKQILQRHDNSTFLTYLVASKITGTPWYILQQYPIDAFDATLEAYYKTISMTVIFTIIILAILLAGLWWWLFERGEQDVTRALKRLHDTTHQQKQLLNGINASLSEGIVLCSTKTGKMLYANSAFSKIANESIAILTEKSYHTLLSSSLNQCLEKIIPLAAQQTKTQKYTETLELNGQTFCYQISSTLFNSDEEQESNESFITLAFHDITSMVATQKQLQMLTEKIVQAMIQAIEVKDPYLSGHAILVAKLAVALSQQLGAADHQETLRLAARLSQIGMIYIPDEIITKSSKLSPEERAKLTTHVSHTLRILEGIDFGLPVQEAISHMYERLDGSGYPHQISGAAISLNGRILAVVASFCAMLRPRSYREPLSLKEALLKLTEKREIYDANVLLALHNFLLTPDGKAFCRLLLTNSPS